MPRLHQPHRVFTKAHWADGWTPQPGMYCDWCLFACSPDVNEAQLTRTFAGQVLTAGDAHQAARNPLSLEGLYVKVEISQDAAGLFNDVKRWIGIIIGEVMDRRGIQHVNQEIGTQVWQARGLELVLQRKVVDSSFVRVIGGDPLEIGRAIGFNLGAGRGNESVRQANMELDIALPVFASSLGEGTSAEEWTAADIVEYLFAFQFPLNAGGIVGLPIFFDPEFGTDILATFKPTLPAEGKNVKQLLDELIDRRRAMTWTLTPDHADFLTPTIEVFTFNKDPLVLPSGQIVPANPRQGTWHSDDDNTIQVHQITADDATRFDQIISRGEPLGACFTVADAYGTNEPDWSEDQQTLYNDGASNDAGYGALDFDEQWAANEAVRNGTANEKVYRHYRMPLDWDGTAGEDFVCPVPFTAPDEAEESVPFWLAGLRFQAKLPLLTETDYEDPTAITAETLDGSKAEYLRPFGVIYDATHTRYFPLSRLPEGGFADMPESGGRHWSASLRMADDQLGIVIDVHGHAQHAIADDEFTPIDEDDDAKFPSDLRWQDIYCTVFAEFDQHVEVRYPEVLTTTADTLRELVIRVPNARLDYLTPGTVLGLDAAGQLITSEGGYVRDDRELLQDIAVSAWQWYGQQRRAITATVHNLVTTFRLGDLITEVGDPTNPIQVNTVITAMRYDLRAGTIKIQTSFAQLDLTAF